MPMSRNRLFLHLPPLTMIPLDVGLTLWGQSPSYWVDGLFANEGNPLAERLLLIHPMAFLGAGFVWLVFVLGLVAVLPRIAALSVSVAVAQAHAWAAGGWIRLFFPYPHLFLAALFLTSAAMAVLACERTRCVNGSQADGVKQTR